jgi:DNA-binding transcriptional regulator LsrR (DeoR family)
MAHTQKQWEAAKTYYEAGLTLREIEDKTGINYAVISKKANMATRSKCQSANQCPNKYAGQ